MCAKIPETNGSTTKIVCDSEENHKNAYEFESIASKIFKDSIEIFSPEENADMVRKLTAFGIKYWCLRHFSLVELLVMVFQKHCQHR